MNRIHQKTSESKANYRKVLQHEEDEISFDVFVMQKHFALDEGVCKKILAILKMLYMYTNT